MIVTALVATSGDPGAGTAFHEFSGRVWAFCKRNARSKNAIIHYRNTKSKNKTENRDEIMSQHYL